MKKILKHSLAAIFSIITFVLSSSSQDLAVKQQKSETVVTAPENKEQSEILYINNVSGKVLKSFYRTFGEKPDVKWFQSDNGFIAIFKDSNTTTNVYFRDNGTIQYKINYYLEDQLPKSVRHTVKSNFYDYLIINVSEVHADGSVWYFIKIEDEHTIKTIRVIGEEWQSVEEMEKQVSSSSR